jgi:hypothetical protein
VHVHRRVAVNQRHPQAAAATAATAATAAAPAIIFSNLTDAIRVILGEHVSS